MIEAGLLVLAQPCFVERRIGALFCAQPARRLREHCLLSWRRSPACGC